VTTLRSGWPNGDSRWGQRFFFCHRVQTGSGAHRTSYLMGTGDSLWVKRSEREADHSPPPSAEVSNVWSYTFTGMYFLMTWCSVKHRNFTCYSIKGIKKLCSRTMKVVERCLCCYCLRSNSERRSAGRTVRLTDCRISAMLEVRRLLQRSDRIMCTNLTYSSLIVDCYFNAACVGSPQRPL